MQKSIVYTESADSMVPFLTQKSSVHNCFVDVQALKQVGEQIFGCLCRKAESGRRIWPDKARFSKPVSVGSNESTLL